MRLALSSCTLVLLACAVAPTSPSPSPTPTPTPPTPVLAPPLTIPLTPLRKRLRTVEVEIGPVKGQFLFDSAGGVTMVSPDFAQRMGCTPRGRIVGFRMMGDRLDTPRCDGAALTIAGRSFTPRSVGVLDLSSYLAPDETQPDGGLGLDAFEGRVVTLDVAHDALIVETPDSFAARILGATELPTRISREAQGASLSVSVGVPTTQGLAWFELDSGNGGTVLVSKHLAALFELDASVEGPQHLDLDIAPGVHFSTDDAFAPELILDGNLGMPFLSQHVVTFDLAHERVWVRPTA